MIEPNRKQLDFLYKKVIDACKDNEIHKNSYSYMVSDGKYIYEIEFLIGKMQKFTVSSTNTSSTESVIKTYTLGYELEDIDKLFYENIIYEFSKVSDRKFIKIFNDYSITERDDKFDNLLGDKKIKKFDIDVVIKMCSQHIYPFLIGAGLTTLIYFISR